MDFLHHIIVHNTFAWLVKMVNDDNDNTHHHPCGDGDASATVGVWDDVTVADGEESDRDQPHCV